MNNHYDPPLQEGDLGYIPMSPDTEDSCQAVSPGRMFCTEPPGHPMPHLAHGVSGNLYAAWEEETPS